MEKTIETETLEDLTKPIILTRKPKPTQTLNSANKPAFHKTLIIPHNRQHKAPTQNKQPKPNNLTISEYNFHLTNTTSKITAKTEKDVKKRRTPERKYGRYKWLRMLIDRNTTELREIRRIVSGVSRGLSYLMDFDSEYLLKTVCCDSRDEVILDVLRAAGSDGLSPKEIHAKVRRYGLKYHHISRRIKRMNKRMQNEIGERVADKVGRNWALSDFMLHNWSAKTNEIETEM